MDKKKTVIVTVVASGVVVMAGLTGALGIKAYAEDSPTFFSRVAEILGVKEDDLKAAMDTARDEGLRPERLGMGEGEGGMMRGGRGMGKDMIKADLAEFLGITEEKVGEAMDAGKRPYEIIEDNGKSEADFHEFMLQKRITDLQDRLKNYQSDSEQG